MDKIASFTVNHLKLESGLYISRKDQKNGQTVTTFDLRFTMPNREEPMDISSMHTIEHLGATFLRNSKRKDDIVYFGPMGCRTGFYLIVFGNETPETVMNLVLETLEFIINFEGEIPGATAIECGNYSDQDLAGAKRYAKTYKDRLISQKNTVYPN